MVWKQRNLIVYLKTHTLAVYFVKKLFQYHICHYCCFNVDIKTHEKKMEERNLVVVLRTHTCSSFCKEAAPIRDFFNKTQI